MTGTAPGPWTRSRGPHPWWFDALGGQADPEPPPLVRQWAVGGSESDGEDIACTDDETESEWSSHSSDHEFIELGTNDEITAPQSPPVPSC